MPWIEPNALLLIVAGFVASGCNAHKSVSAGGTGGWETGYRFWPPPPSTTIWTTETVASVPDASFGPVAAHIARVLEQAGYSEQRLYPMGVHYEHGFAVTTRLERIRDDAMPETPPDRWTAQFPEAATLIWLRDRSPRFPHPGRYRTFLIAFTDLPTGDEARSVRWNEQTVMMGPELHVAAFPVRRRVPPGYRFAVYVYEYLSDPRLDEESLVSPADTRLPGAAHIERSGLLSLRE